MSNNVETRVGVIRPLTRPGDLGWVVMAHGESYHREFGWDVEIEALAARFVADYAADHDPGREAGWIAEVDGERVGCLFCVADDATTRGSFVLVNRAAVGVGWELTWWTRASSSGGLRATGASRCGPTTCSFRPAASTRQWGSSWSRRGAASSATTWWGSTGRATSSVRER